MSKSIVLWLGDIPDQNALACRTANEFNVIGIVYERKKSSSFKRITVGKIVGKLFLGKLDNAWVQLQSNYKTKYPKYPKVKTIVVENINSEEAFNFTKELSPDLIAVSGTRLVKGKLLSLKPSLGIINLHTGLSPYINGGPNCTNWCLTNKTFHLIGNTVMWINEGIDGGNIITTQTVTLKGSETFSELHLNVIEEAHALYLNAIRLIIKSPQLCPNVPQDSIGKGVVYYNKMWGLSQKLSALKNFSKLKSEVENGNVSRLRAELRLVNVPDVSQVK